MVGHRLMLHNVPLRESCVWFSAVVSKGVDASADDGVGKGKRRPDSSNLRRTAAAMLSATSTSVFPRGAVAGGVVVVVAAGTVRLI